jgi:hypothetical protein
VWAAPSWRGQGNVRDDHQPTAICGQAKSQFRAASTEDVCCSPVARANRPADSSSGGGEHAEICASSGWTARPRVLQWPLLVRPRFVRRSHLEPEEPKRDVAMEKLTGELITGMQQCFTFRQMLNEAIAATAPHLKCTSDSSKDFSYIGFYLDNGKLWVGINSKENRDAIRFITWKLPVAWNADRQAGIGRLEQDARCPGGNKLVHKLSLDGEFFALSRGEQQQRIEQHLAQFLGGVEKIKNASQMGNSPGP